jgi:ribosomal protein S12 methylthiotransferase
VIPKLRGGLQSRPEDVILKEARHLVSNGIEELVIIGQDTGDWGRDIFKELRLASLLRKLRDIDGVRWIRLMYMHPHSFTPDLMNVFAESPEKFPYLDMPLQHIDHWMLSEMKRKLGEAPLRSLVESIRTKLPKLSLRTTFIVGFPGETDAQFERLLDFVKEGHFDYLGAFAYSQEEGTPAGIRTDQVPESVRKERQSAITEAHFDVTAQKALKRIGAVETVVIDNSEEGEVIGRTRMEAPEIDAVVRLPQSAARKGRFVKAKLTGYDAYEFTAELSS